MRAEQPPGRRDVQSAPPGATGAPPIPYRTRMTSSSTPGGGAEVRQPTRPATTVTPSAYPRIGLPTQPAVVAICGGVLLAVVLLASAGALPFFVVGLALAYLIDPAVTWLERRGVPRWLGSLVMVLVLALVILAFFVIVANAVVSQGEAFVATAPRAAADIRARIETADLPPFARDAVGRLFTGIESALASIDVLGLGRGVVESAFGLFGVVVGVIGLPFYVFLVVNDRPGLVQTMNRRLPDPWRDDLVAVGAIFVRQFGNYFRSEAILMVLLGLATWLGLLLITVGVDGRIGGYAAFLAVIAAFSELLPLIGPWIATIPALLVGVTLGPGALVAIVVVYFVIAQLESNVMVPAIEGRSFDLRPALVGPVIAVGAVIGGALGAILAVPVATAARDAYLYIFRRSTGRSAADLAATSDAVIRPPA
jgi:predicted PurR-regulated permease PerM